MDARFGHLEGTGRPRRAVASCPELHAAGIPPGAAIRVRAARDAVREVEKPARVPGHTARVSARVSAAVRDIGR